jgi:hypothetical protein
MQETKSNPGHRGFRIIRPANLKKDEKHAKVSNEKVSGQHNKWTLE